MGLRYIARLTEAKQKSTPAGEVSISIVVPTWNRLGPLATCVESLLVQDYPARRYEIVVVENGSTDQARLRLARHSSSPDLPAVRFISLRRRDANAARNVGVRAARGGLICLVDDDVIAPPGWLSALSAGAARHPEADCLGGPVRPRFEAPAPRTCDAHALPGTVLDLGDSETEVRQVWGPNMAVPRRSFERVGLFREGLELEQEWEWQERLVFSGGKIVYVPGAWLWHRIFGPELRLRGLLQEHFQRGLTRGLIGTPAPARVLARRISAEFGHGVGARCTWGLTQAARHTGMLWAHAAGSWGRGYDIRSREVPGASQVLRRPRSHSAEDQEPDPQQGGGDSDHDGDVRSATGHRDRARSGRIHERMPHLGEHEGEGVELHSQRSQVVREHGHDVEDR